MAHTLIVLPDDTAQPILAAIDGASRTLLVKMFVFSDPSLLKAVIMARRRGVKVRVMLNRARRSGEHDNEATRKALERADIDVKDANPAFDLTHEKSMVVDEETAFVKSLNWATTNLTETRDYAVITTRRHDVAEMIECFEQAGFTTVVIDLERWTRLPTPRRRLTPEFRSLPNDELLVSAFSVRLRPRRT